MPVIASEKHPVINIQNFRQLLSHFFANGSFTVLHFTDMVLCYSDLLNELFLCQPFLNSAATNTNACCLLDFFVILVDVTGYDSYNALLFLNLI